MRALLFALVLASAATSYIGCGASTKSSSGPGGGADNAAGHGGGAGAGHGGLGAGAGAGHGGAAGTHATAGGGAFVGSGGDAGNAGTGTRGSGGSGDDAAGGGAGASAASSGGASGMGIGGGAAAAGKGGSSAGGASGGSGGEGGSSGEGASGQAGSAGEPAIECTGTTKYFPEFDRGCATDDDCVVVAHQTSCCGDELATGISASEQAAFAAAEAICEQQYPACGCAAQGVAVEDGTQLDFSRRSEVVATCDAGTCQAHYSGASFACGTRRCTEEQYCVQSSGGPAGTPTSYSCSPTACTDCSCITMPDCTCTDDDGQLTFTCQHA